MTPCTNTKTEMHLMNQHKLPQARRPLPSALSPLLHSSSSKNADILHSADSSSSAARAAAELQPSPISSHPCIPAKHQRF